MARELLRFEERAREDVRNSSSGDDGGGGMDAKEDDDDDGFGLVGEGGGGNNANSRKLVDRAERTMGSTPLHLAAVLLSSMHNSIVL